MRNVILNKGRSKNSINVENTINVQLRENAPLTPLMPIDATVSRMAIYDRERKACGSIRLTAAVDVVATNVLFNNITEVVKNEGSANVMVANYTPEKIKNEEIRGKNKEYFESSGFTRDTQLTSGKGGYTYHCGLDIFNNHILRSNTFKSVGAPKSGVNPEFNTIGDFLRDDEGKDNKLPIFTDTDTLTIKPNQHIYRKTDIDTFSDAIYYKLREENGWFGFTNKSNIRRKSADKDMGSADKDMGIEKVINNAEDCEFIDLYPGRDLYKFGPNFNKHRNRMEKNWDYLLLYPSSSTTENVGFINQSIGSMKITMYDDRYVSRGGLKSVKIYCIAKHGLQEGDTVSIFVGDDKVLERELYVNEIIDDFTFAVTRGRRRFPSKWYRKDLLEQQTIDGFSYEESQKYPGVITRKKDGITENLQLIGDMCNIDPDCKRLSFKRSENGTDCVYYIRIFSKVPNFKWAEEDTTEYELYKPGSNLIGKYQESGYDFENHYSSLAFARNIYNDPIGEIVYSDDIEFKKLRSNIGFHVTEMFLSFKKSNNGYREWYGKNGVSKTDSESVEFSHAFGKVNCAFELSDASISDDIYCNVRCIHNVDNSIDGVKPGLDMSVINNGRPNGLDKDEIFYGPIKWYDGKSTVDYDGDKHFYGDLCEFNPSDFTERSIQQVKYRFNTAQRELNEKDGSYKSFSNLYYDEIEMDDIDGEFKIKSEDFEKVCQRKEGYVYEPHKRIRIQTFSRDVTIDEGKRFYIKQIKDNGNGEYEIWTYDNNFLEIGGNFFIYNRETGETTRMEVNKLMTLKKCVATVKSDIAGFSISDLGKLILIKPDSGILPTNAYVMNDGTSRLAWREIIPNGYDMFSDIEQYPFANQALYINANLKIYVTRQMNPYADNGEPYDIEPMRDDEKNRDKYYKPKDIIC